MWTGFILAMDAIVLYRSGSSLITRSLGRFILLFVASAPAWWLFELLNLRGQNWSYQGRELFSGLHYAAFATFSFSTVMPAVFEASELASTFRWIRRLGKGPEIGAGRAVPHVMFASGAVMLALFLLRPRWFFPLMWISVFCIIDPLNGWLGNRTLSLYAARGDWRPAAALGTGCLMCGFFWEMWNYFSFPRWIYSVPYVGFMKVFEMPLLGYGGYIPFALELFALYHLAAGIVGKKGRAETWYIRTIAVDDQSGEEYEET